MHDYELIRQRTMDALPFVQGAGEQLLNDLSSEAEHVQLPGGYQICLEGNLCSRLPIVLSGTARVYKQSEAGREITLYRILPGESCILTASCMLSSRPFPAFAATETEVGALLIPITAFRAWIETHAAWRTYVFDLLATRLAAVMETVEEVAFRRVDARLAAYLLEEGDEVSRTHETIAFDLGTSREVVSRILKEFENEGFVTLSRAVVRTLDPVALRARTGTP